MHFKEKVDKSIEVIRKAFDQYESLGVGCSFGKDSMVLVHLVMRVNKNVPIFFTTTPYKPKETQEFAVRMKDEWGMNLAIVEADEKIDGKPWEIDPHMCCQHYKVEPMKRIIAELGLDGWFAGIRRGEGRTRGEYQYFEERDKLIKINPILEWSEMDIWKYSALYDIPQNILYKAGYRSLGCEPCTALIDDDEEERAGRWRGTIKQGGECGIHTQSLRAEGKFLGLKQRSYTPAQRLAFIRQLHEDKRVPEQQLPFVHPTAVVYDCVELGARVYIGAHAVVGGKGVGAVWDENGHIVEFPQFGKVKIGDDVIIRSNATIDRGTLDTDSTIIGDRCIIGPKAHVGHNVNVESDSLILGDAIVCGGAKIGKRTKIGANATIRNRAIIGDDVEVALGSCVFKDIPNGKKWIEERTVKKTLDWKNL